MNTQGEGYLFADAPSIGNPSASDCRNYEQQYEYDKVGNLQYLRHRVMQNSSLNFTRKYLYATTTNQHLQITNNQQNPTVYNSYTYDSAGNMLTSNADRSYSWDAFGRLRTFQIASGGSVTKFAHYIYDAGGSRTKKLIINQQGNYESVTYIDGVMEYHRKVTFGNVEEKNYLSLQGGVELRIGGYTGDMSQSEVYTISDYLSSGGTRLDSSGAVIDSEEYYPYGESSLTTYGKKRYRYTGKEKDEESGLYYMAARYYCCSSAKFISVDSLAGKYAHQSSYCYADCNPVMKNDPSGMQSETSSNRTKCKSSKKSRKQLACIKNFMHKIHFYRNPCSRNSISLSG